MLAAESVGERDEKRARSFTILRILVSFWNSGNPLSDSMEGLIFILKNSLQMWWLEWVDKRTQGGMEPTEEAMPDVSCRRDRMCNTGEIHEDWNIGKIQRNLPISVFSRRLMMASSTHMAPWDRSRCLWGSWGIWACWLGVPWRNLSGAVRKITGCLWFWGSGISVEKSRRF